MRNPNEQDGQRRGRWTPPRWVVHIALAWYIIGSIIGLLLETTTGPWWWAAYHGLAGGNGLGLIVYVNLGAYLLAEEFDMIISRLNNLKDREEAEAKARRELRAAEAAAREAARQETISAVAAARQEAAEAARQEAQEAARQETISAVAAARQQLTPEELDNLPAAMRDLLNRYAGDNANGSDNGTASR